MRKMALVRLFFWGLLSLSGCGMEEKMNQCDVEYWIAKMENPNQILMTEQQIQNYNEQMFSNEVLLEQGKLYRLKDAESGWGIVTSRTDLRSEPTDEPLGDDPETDLRQETALLMNEPVIVEKASDDGEWYLVTAYHYRGWVRCGDIALCDSKKQWEEQWNANSFLLIFGDCISVGENVYTMGTRLPLEKEQKNKGCYQVLLPERDDKGRLVTRRTEIPEDEKVCEGYLPYTGANILKLAFQCMGDEYGWGGINGKRDCSSLVMEIYRCFGFCLPRNASGQVDVPGEHTVFRDKSTDERIRLLGRVMPGALLQMPGHIMIYLGEDYGKHYVINAVGSYVPEELLKRGEIQPVRINMVAANSLSVGRKSGESWLDSLNEGVEILTAE